MHDSPTIPDVPPCVAVNAPGIDLPYIPPKLQRTSLLDSAIHAPARPRTPTVRAALHVAPQAVALCLEFGIFQPAHQVLWRLEGCDSGQCLLTDGLHVVFGSWEQTGSSMTGMEAESVRDSYTNLPSSPGVMQHLPLQPVFLLDLNFHCNSSLFSMISYSDKRT